MSTESPLVVREPKAAQLLGVSIAALRRWRREKRGPAFVRLQRCIGYRMADIEAFIGENRVAPSPEHTTGRIPAQEGRK